MRKKKMNNLDKIKLIKIALVTQKLNIKIDYNVLEYNNLGTLQAGYSSNRNLQVIVRKKDKGYNYGLIIELIKNNIIISTFSDYDKPEARDLDYVVTKMSTKIKELIALIKTYIKEKKIPDKHLVEQMVALTKFRVNYEKILVMQNPSSLFSDICGDILRLVDRDLYAIIRHNDKKIRKI